MYPNIALGVTTLEPTESYIILKDKAYKELRPGQWNAYTEFERGLVLENANNALTRLGYLDTHPLRKRIAETSASAPPLKKHTGLGGGILAGSKRAASTQSSPSILVGVAGAPASPLSLPLVKNVRAATRSPDSDASRKINGKNARATVLPAKESLKRRFVPSLSLSAASSEDERGNKRTKNSSSRTNSSASSGHSNITNGTPPSSTNDDGPNGDRSDDDVKLLSITKIPTLVPLQLASVVSSTEKKHQYYVQLATKFRTKYSEYEKLYRLLQRDHKKGSAAEKKKQLKRLFEMHNSLAEWKKKLWDYHNQNNLTEGIMNLSKYRKHSSILGTISSTASPAPPLASLKFNKAHTTSPAVVASDRFGSSKPQFMRKLPATHSSAATKVGLDY